MKRVLLLLDTLNTGGEEKSAISLLHELVGLGCDVTVMMFSPGGTFFDELPKSVKVVTVPFTNEGRSLFYNGLKKSIAICVHKPWCLKLGQACIRSLLYTRVRNRELRQCFEMEAWLDKRTLSGTAYDVLMAYSSRLQLHMIGAKFIRAKKKILWLHCELENCKFEPRPFLRYWKEYDVWAAANSQKISRDYSSVFPAYASRIIQLPLFISADLCLKRANAGESLPRSGNGLQIVSVGRVAYQKGFDWVVDIVDLLKKYGIDLVWTIVGDGPERAALEASIRTRGLESSVVLAGNQSNPYPYFDMCDIYVQPSRYEGYCITLAEARAFAKPIVATKFAGACEQLVDGKTGLLVDFSVDAIASAIRRLACDADLRNVLSKNLVDENARGALRDVDVLKRVLE